MSSWKFLRLLQSWLGAPRALDLPYCSIYQPERLAGCSAFLAELQASWRQSGLRSLVPGQGQAERRACRRAQGACAEQRKEGVVPWEKGPTGQGLRLPVKESSKTHLPNKSRQILNHTHSWCT